MLLKNKSLTERSSVRSSSTRKRKKKEACLFVTKNGLVIIGLVGSCLFMQLDSFQIRSLVKAVK